MYIYIYIYILIIIYHPMLLFVHLCKAPESYTNKLYYQYYYFANCFIPFCQFLQED